MKTEGDTPAKKPYATPHLRVYGDVRTLTESSLKNKGAADGGQYGKALKTGG